MIAQPKPGCHMLAVGDTEGTISLWEISMNVSKEKDNSHEKQQAGTTAATSTAAARALTISYRLLGVPSHRGMSLGFTQETKWDKHL